jgi:hypothetical protein
MKLTACHISVLVLVGALTSIHCRPAIGGAGASSVEAAKGAVRWSSLGPAFDAQSACNKEDFLWRERVEPSVYAKDRWPELKGPDIFNLAWTTLARHLTDKMDYVGDQAPVGWTKPIHRRGAVARVKFVSAEGSSATGIFQGAPCGLLRLSLTSHPKTDAFNPGFAWKVLIDGQPSKNISALVSLDGQGANFNFFHNNFSNVVPPSKKLSSRAVKVAFETVSKHAHKIGVEEFSEVSASGRTVTAARGPRQLIFVPDASIRTRFATAPIRDFREDLIQLSAGASLFQVYGVDEPIADEAWNPLLRAGAEVPIPPQWQRLGMLVLKSGFLVSEWGDDGVFFKHQRYNRE